MRLFRLSLLLLVSATVNADMQALTIDVSTAGGALDGKALQKVRKSVGLAIQNNVVDTFIVYSPRTGGPIFREGGLSACAEAAFGVEQKKFAQFMKQLKAINPKAGTFVNVEAIVTCKPLTDNTPNNPQQSIACGGIAGRPCPDNLVCVDDPKDNCDPTHGGADCSGICITKTP